MVKVAIAASPAGANTFLKRKKVTCKKCGELGDFQSFVYFSLSLGGMKKVYCARCHEECSVDK